MKSMLVESIGTERHIYESVLLSTKNLKLLGNPTASKILAMLAEEELCAIDIARKLKVHEQNIYYHIRNLEKAGVVRVARNEMRYGMTAKLYEPVASVVAAKLFENGHVVEQAKQEHNSEILHFLSPFIKDGKLNAKIVVGDPYPHGKYESGSADGCYVADVAHFFGNFVRSPLFPCYTLDIRMTEDDMKNHNLIVIGSPKGNVTAQKINEFMSINFDENSDWTINSNISRKKYDDEFTGIIAKLPNPFNKKKSLLYIGGKRTRGTLSASLAFTRHTEQFARGNIYDRNIIARVVRGFDMDGDGYIDTVKFLE